MSGEIFISYRRQESGWSARSLHYRLCKDFNADQIFMDLDAIALGEDFIESIETTVAECDVLIAVIGNDWLTSKDERGGCRLDNPEDFVRREIGTALKRGIRVIPVLFDGASMPRVDDLPEDLKPLVRRNALLITDTSPASFEGDYRRLASAIRQVWEKVAPEERERLATEQRQREDRQRLEAEARQKEEKERLEVDQREKEPLEVELETEQRKKENLGVEGRSPNPALFKLRDLVLFKIRGNNYLVKKDYDKAISAFSEAVKLDPEYGSAYNQRGRAYYYKEDYDKAISDYTRAIWLDPEYADGYFDRAFAYSAKGENDKAISDYSEFIRLSPKEGYAYYWRGICYRAQGNEAKAQADVDKAKQLGYL